jgi:hypothetical protein
VHTREGGIYTELGVYPTMRIHRTTGLIPLGGLLALAACCAAAAAAEAPAPPNDAIANAQAIHSFPSTVRGTTVGATLAIATVGGTVTNGEPPAGCGTVAGSVWYSVRPTSAQRIAIDLAADGALDATVEVFHAVRSQLQSVACEATDSHGKASLSFAASKNGLYDIRVASRIGSQLAGFTLEAFQPTPAVAPPGPPLPSGGVSGKVDRVQNINAAYSMTLHQGVSYLINLAEETPNTCVSGGLFAPGTSSFERPALVRVRCGGYRLFTPGPGEGGRYSFQVTPEQESSKVQRFHLQVGVAGSAETAPGLVLGNYARARGRLDGSGVRVLRLYRLDEHTHSNLTLKLAAPETAHFNLQLRNGAGHVIACECGGGGSKTLTQQLRPGRYYAVVSVRDRSAGNFTLIRESRTITSTALSFSSSTVSPGQPVSIGVSITPAASGRVTIDIERFDPVFGWQFYREDHVTASGGSASDSLVAPSVGHWRAKASYGGSRTASPSAVGHRYLLVR